MKLMVAAIIFLLGVSLVQSGPVVVDEVPVAPVWPGHPVGFCLITRGERQYTAFYDAKRQMTVGVRKLNLRSWQFVKLDEVLGWDSHNYVTFAFDRNGFIHLSGNMHGHQLVYFRSEKPEDIQSLVRQKAMTGKLEGHVTYPHFFTNNKGDLIFTYRDGSSGKGDQIYNIYNADNQQWKRLLDTPLTDGRA